MITDILFLVLRKYYVALFEIVTSQISVTTCGGFRRLCHTAMVEFPKKHLVAKITFYLAGN